MWQGKSLYWQAIDEGDVWLFRKCIQCQPHRPVGCAEDVDFIDLGSLHEPDRPDDLRVPGDLIVEHLATLFRELLGVV